MSDDLLSEAERIAAWHTDEAAAWRADSGNTPLARKHEATAATLRALAARVREAEAERDRMATDLAVALADLDNSGATSVEIAAERDTALTSLAAERAAGERMREAIQQAHTRIINLGLLDPDGRIETVRLGLAIALDRASTAAEAGRHE